jgi:hypothetical protein
VLNPLVSFRKNPKMEKATKWIAPNPKKSPLTPILELITKTVDML